MSELYTPTTDNLDDTNPPGRNSSCPHDKTKCINSRQRNGYRYRRHECLNCGHRFTTVEVPIDSTSTGPGGALRVLQQELWELSPRQEKAINQLIEAFSGERLGKQQYQE